MLENQPSMKPVFFNCKNSHPKIIDCIRVDGASDEGPSHEVVDSETGKVNEIKLKNNLSLAIDAYVSRVDGSPCSETRIKLFHGSDSGSYQLIRQYLELKS